MTKMLRACALENQANWDSLLPYAEFSYNNSFQASLQMSPFEALLRKKKVQNTLVLDRSRRRTSAWTWYLEGSRRIAQSRQKSYADNRRRDLAFALGDHVYLKSHLSKECVASGSVGSLHLDTLDLFLFWTEGEKWPTNWTSCPSCRTCMTSSTCRN